MNVTDWTLCCPAALSAGWTRNRTMATRPPVTEWTVVCAWCEHEKPEAERLTGELVSHGCCPQHLAAIRTEHNLPARVAARKGRV